MTCMVEEDHGLEPSNIEKVSVQRGRYKGYEAEAKMSELVVSHFFPSRESVSRTSTMTGSVKRSCYMK